MAYRSANKTVYSAKYHWCPKYRRRVLVGAVEDRLKELVGETAGDLGARVIELEVMPYHVHLLLEIPPAVPLSSFIGQVKGRTSRILRREFPALRLLPTPCTRSWFVSTVGGVPLEVVRRYIENQKAVA